MVRKLRFIVRPTTKSKRGFADANACVELLKENWDELGNALDALTEEEKDELLDHFNAAVSGLGEALFGGDIIVFEDKIKGFNDEEQKSFVAALEESELMVIDDTTTLNEKA